MKKVTLEYLNNYDNESYIWYACYGSNINYDRFMYYINGDSKEKLGFKTGCTDKTMPLEELPYIIKHPIYFASNSKNWGGGIAFLDYEKEGFCYGKIYKIKISQFKDILKQEQDCILYDTIVLIDYYDNLPIFTFTANHKLKDILNNPSNKYIEVIKKGLKNTYPNLSDSKIYKYLKN